MATTGINAIDNVVENFQLAGISVDDSGNVTAEQGLQLYDENGDITTLVLQQHLVLHLVL